MPSLRRPWQLDRVKVSPMRNKIIQIAKTFQEKPQWYNMEQEPRQHKQISYLELLGLSKLNTEKGMGFSSTHRTESGARKILDRSLNFDW